MKRKTFTDLVAEHAKEVEEVFPWDLVDEMESSSDIMLLDVRCPSEFDAVHIEGSINVPRGILETACDYGYEETVPLLVEARQRRIAVVCRSGNRSVLAAYTLKQLGYEAPVSLKTGLRGWNDYEQPLVDKTGTPISADDAEEILTAHITPEQLGPKKTQAPNVQ